MTDPDGDAKEQIRAVIAGVLGIAIVFAMYSWIGQVTTGWVSVWCRRLCMVAAAAMALCLGDVLVEAVFRTRRRRRTEREVQMLAQESARTGRKMLRESTREFMLFLDDQYGWVHEMPELEQERRALLWYDEITSRWVEENQRFHKLRSNDECPAVDEEIGLERVEAMYAIWDRRTELYQFAIAWSDPADRAREILRIGRRIRQVQVEEAREQQRFAEDVEVQLAEQDEGDEGESEAADVAWGPHAVRPDDIRNEVLKEIQPNEESVEAKA